MRIYYRDAKLCGSKNGNGEKQPLLRRWQNQVARSDDQRLFCLADIKKVLRYAHLLSERNISAPFRYVHCQSHSQWYSISDGLRAFLPTSLCFTEGSRCFAIVVIDDQFELRVWSDCHVSPKHPDSCFSHQPLTDEKDRQRLKASFVSMQLELEQQHTSIS